MQPSKVNFKWHLQRKWMLPLMVGFVITMAAGFMYHKMHPPIDPEIAQIAAQNGYNPRVYSDVLQLIHNSSRDKDLDEVDFTRLKQILHDPNINMRDDALAALMNMKRSPHREAALQIGKTFLNDPTMQLQASALLLMWKLKDPALQVEVDKRRSSTDPLIKNALGIIDRNLTPAHKGG